MFSRRSTAVWGLALLCFALACSSGGGGEPTPYTEDPATANNTGGGSDNGANGSDNGAPDEDGGNGKPPGRRDAGTSSAPDAMVSLDSGLKRDAGASPDSGTKPDAGMTMDSGTKPDAGMTMDSGTKPEAGTSMDSGTKPDAGMSMDSGTKPDAGTSIDSGTKPDAGTGIDSGTGTDSGAGTDAGTKPDAGPSCGTAGLVAGNNCPGVVSCQDEAFSGDPVLVCTLTGTAPNRCCTTPFGANDSCRTTACGANDDEATCDGPEDCAGVAGAVCCFNAGAAACATTCTNPNRMCHKDADCPTGTTCEAGANAQGSQYSWWGFCRGT